MIKLVALEENIKALQKDYQMQAWERRLKDLSRLLENCEKTYFDPDLFRMNTNQFLQTSRTVTFIIQKNKLSIPDFDHWYEENVLKPWKADSRMKWAKNSRNTIEKEGDLELHSTLSTTLILGYLHETDISIEVGQKQLIGANVEGLIRFAERKLPSVLSDGAYVKIERRWVANTLPNWELLTALAYVFGQVREVCEQLANHMNLRLDAEISHARDFDTEKSDVRKVRYVLIRGRESGRIKYSNVPTIPNFKPPPKLEAFKESQKGLPPPNSFQDLMNFHVSMAELNFEAHGNHAPMLFMYDANWRLVDRMMTQFGDQTEKYVFWRSVSERMLIIKPKIVIFVGEAWIRDLKNQQPAPIRKLPILGEVLQLFGITDDREMEEYSWDIQRDVESGEARLGEAKKDAFLKKDQIPNFLVPISRSFEMLNSTT